MAGRKKRRKRPLKGGGLKPEGYVRKGGRRPGGVGLSRRQVRWGGALLGVLTPLLVVGLAVLGSHPDWAAPAMIVAVVVLLTAVIGLLVLRPTWWVLGPGLLLGVVMLVVPGEAVRAEIALHRAVSTEVVITAAHSGTKDKAGHIGWTCDIRRQDGRPLPYPTIEGGGCWGRESVGSTQTVLVDPAGWAPPVPEDWDAGFYSAGVPVVAVAAVLWGLLVFATVRRRLRGQAPG